MYPAYLAIWLMALAANLATYGMFVWRLLLHRYPVFCIALLISTLSGGLAISIAQIGGIAAYAEAWPRIKGIGMILTAAVILEAYVRMMAHFREARAFSILMGVLFLGASVAVAMKLMGFGAHWVPGVVIRTWAVIWLLFLLAARGLCELASRSVIMSSNVRRHVEILLWLQGSKVVAWVIHSAVINDYSVWIIVATWLQQLGPICCSVWWICSMSTAGEYDAWYRKQSVK